MNVLDTNVVSELMRPEPSEAVVAWVSGQPAVGLYTTTVTQAEILCGVLLLPAGQRRTRLLSAAQAMFEVEFAGRVLAFGAEAALAYARLAADRRAAGRPIASFDAQIAAIARASGARVVTRNVDDFDGCGVAVVNPWE